MSRARRIVWGVMHLLASAAAGVVAFTITVLAWAFADNATIIVALLLTIAAGLSFLAGVFLFRRSASDRRSFLIVQTAAISFALSYCAGTFVILSRRHATGEDFVFMLGLPLAVTMIAGLECLAVWKLPISDRGNTIPVPDSRIERHS